MWQSPRPLQTGDQIAVVAPASCVRPEEIAHGVALLRAWGFTVHQRDDLFAGERYLAGPDTRRAAELMQWLTDPDIAALICARGGYGCSRIIPLLDVDALRRLPHPKMVIGYSDVTTLQGWLARTLGWPSLYAPNLGIHLGAAAPASNGEHLRQLLLDPARVTALPTDTVRVLSPGTAHGRITGGCLTLLHAALGTNYAWPLEGICLLEDRGEKLYALDRMLTHLQHAGAFDRVTGIVFGSLQLHPDEPHPEQLDAILTDCLRNFPGPVVTGFPAGHTDPFYAVPLGTHATLTTQPMRLALSHHAA